MKKVTLPAPVVIQPEVKTSEVTIVRVVYLPAQNRFRIFCRELMQPIEVAGDDPNFSKLPTFDEDALNDIVAAGAGKSAGRHGPGRLRPGA